MRRESIRLRSLAKYGDKEAKLSRLLKYSPDLKPILPRSIMRARLFSHPGIFVADSPLSGSI